MTNMTKMEAAEKIISQEGECVGVSCRCCPSETGDGNCIVGGTIDYVDADSYMKNKTEWFQKWMVKQIAEEGACHGRCSKCPLDYYGVPSIRADDRRQYKAMNWLKTKEAPMSNDSMLEKIEKLERELAELKDDLKQKNEMVFDRHHSYVALDAGGMPYYLVASADDIFTYAWHSLVESNHTTWDGLHDEGQEALDSIMEEGISAPWTIHEFDTGVDALEFYLNAVKKQEE